MLMSALEEEVAPYLEERHAETPDALSWLLVVRKGQGGRGAGSRAASCRRICAVRRRWPRCPAGFVLAGAFNGDLAQSSRRCSGRGGSRGGLRLTAVWEEKYRQFCKRSLEGGDNVYVWADGVHFNVRLSDERLGTLVLIGARADGQKEVIAVEDGDRKSAESLKTVL
jgi:hypothetical protein